MKWLDPTIYCGHGKKYKGEECPECNRIWNQECLERAQKSVAKYQASLAADTPTGAAAMNTPKVPSREDVERIVRGFAGYSFSHHNIGSELMGVALDLLAEVERLSKLAKDAGTQWGEACRDNQQLRAQLAEVTKDAERYRYLRDGIKWAVGCDQKLKKSTGDSENPLAP